MYCKEKWRTAGGKDPLFGHVDGFQIDPKIFKKDNAYRLNAASHNILRKSDLLDR